MDTAARRFKIADKVLAYLGLLADLGYVGLAPDVIVGYKRKRGEKVLLAGKKAANITIAVKAVQTLQYWGRDPFGPIEAVA